MKDQVIARLAMVQDEDDDAQKGVYVSYHYDPATGKVYCRERRTEEEEGQLFEVDRPDLVPKQ